MYKLIAFMLTKKKIIYKTNSLANSTKLAFSSFILFIFNLDLCKWCQCFRTLFCYLLYFFG